jgi:hypothetical protein
MINLISPSVAFVATFLAAFGRLDPFDRRLMYLWVLFSTFWPFSVTADTGKEACCRTPELAFSLPSPDAQRRLWSLRPPCGA